MEAGAPVKPTFAVYAKTPHTATPIQSVPVSVDVTVAFLSHSSIRSRKLSLSYTVFHAKFIGFYRLKPTRKSHYGMLTKVV